MRIGLVACCAQKRSGVHQAKDLYISPLFRLSLRYSLQEYDETFILSAMHGVVALHQRLHSYNLALQDLDPANLFTWRMRVRDQLRKLDPPDGKGRAFYYLAGKLYQTAYPGVNVFGRMGIGERLQWLNERLR